MSETATRWVFDLIDSTGYIGVFFLMLAETVFPPIPSEVIMPVAGLRAADGPMPPSLPLGWTDALLRLRRHLGGALAAVKRRPTE